MSCAGAQPAHVAADEVLPRVGQGLGGGGDGAGDVLVEVEAVERHPAGQVDVDQHQRVVGREVDVDVVGRVVGAVPGQVDPLPADAQRAVGLEGHVGHRPGRVVVPGQQPLGLDVADPDHVAAEQRRGAEVVGVVVRVDDVGHLVGHAVGGRDLVDGALQVVPDARGCVEQHHPVLGGQEGRLVGAVGDPVQVPLHPPDEVALRVDGRAERGRRYRRVVGQRVVGGRPGSARTPPATVASAGTAAIAAPRARNERRFVGGAG